MIKIVLQEFFSIKMEKKLKQAQYGKKNITKISPKTIFLNLINLVFSSQS